ncbi:hypothetical protein EI94DRAFT_1746663, partial [Lactarius quietus]
MDMLQVRVSASVPCTGVRIISFVLLACTAACTAFTKWCPLGSSGHDDECVRLIERCGRVGADKTWCDCELKKKEHGISSRLYRQVYSRRPVAIPTLGTSDKYILCARGCPASAPNSGANSQIRLSVEFFERVKLLRLSAHVCA